MPPAVRSMALIGSLGGLTTMIRHDPDEIAARARQGNEAKFERLAREEAAGRELSPEQFARLVEFVRRRHYRRLAQLSAEARRKQPRRQPAPTDNQHGTPQLAKGRGAHARRAGDPGRASGGGGR